MHEESMLAKRCRTFLVFEAGHSVCSKQDIPCVRSKTFLVFEAGHSLCCEEDISCVPITNNAHANFSWIQPIVPGFGRIVIRFAQTRDDRPNSPKNGVRNFRTSNDSKIARMAPISTIFGRNWLRRPKLSFQKYLRGRKNVHIDEKLSRRHRDFHRRRPPQKKVKTHKQRLAKQWYP